MAITLAPDRTTPMAPDASPAATVRTLAVLLQAGAAGHVAWRHLADADDACAQRVCARHDDGADLVEAIREEGGAWASVASAWSIAATVGAPLGETLRTIAAALDDARDAADDVRVALAEPAATARLMLFLPPIGLLLGAALGFDTFRTVTTHPLGIACLILGITLVLVAHQWTARLIAQAQPDGTVPGLHAELTAIALSGGTSIGHAHTLVDDEHPHAPDRDATQQTLALSHAAGVPAVELLRAGAAHARHESRVAGKLRAAHLASRLLLPLGACTLPAFLLLGVAPLVLSVLTSTNLPLP